MIFKLSSTKCFYEENELPKYEKLGFQFEKVLDDRSFFKGKFRIKYIDVIINIETIESLVEFTKTYGDCIVCENTIEIYNDYRE